MSDRRAQRAARAAQVGFLALLLVCIAQLAYWMADEYRYTGGVRATARAEYEANALWATDLLRGGMSWPDIARHHPEIERTEDGRVRVSRDALARLDADRFHRLNRYTWEGAFFLTVMFGAMAMVYMAMREEGALRRQQELFLAASTHELKSPLASMRLSAETLALRDPPPPRRSELVQRLLADLGRLDRTIANILDATRLSGGSVRSARETVHLGSEVQSAVRGLAPVAAEQGIAIAVDVADDLSIAADREGVQTIVRNLVDNAMKASRGLASGATIGVTGVAVNGTVRLDVRDGGIGFSPSEAGGLFTKFHRIENAGHERLPGTGLGLYLVRRCAELDGGSVEASSDGPGCGARFTVRWPAAGRPRDA